MVQGLCPVQPGPLPPTYIFHTWDGRYVPSSQLLVIEIGSHDFPCLSSPLTTARVTEIYMYEHQAQAKFLYFTFICLLMYRLSQLTHK
jgi:hypothetical protein